jgi:hypothetical protein
MLVFTFMLGFAQVATDHAAKKYAYLCTWKQNKAYEHSRKIENLIVLAGLTGLSATGAYLWFVYDPKSAKKHIVIQYYTLFMQGCIWLAMSLTIVLPRPPFAGKRPYAPLV